MKKIIALLISAVMLIGILAGCGGGAQTGGTDAAPAPEASAEAPAAEGTGLSGTISIAMLATNQPGLDRVIEDFEAANPDAHIEAEYISDIAAYVTDVPTRLTNGTSTDLIHLIAGASSPTSVGVAAQSDVILDLSSEPWVGDMYEGAKELFMMDGKVYAMDFGFCPLACVMYNKDIFAANAIEIPTTFDELKAACQKLIDAGIVPFSYAGAEPNVNTNDVIVMLGNELDDNLAWVSDMKEGKLTFATSDAAKTAVDEFVQLYEMGAFTPGTEAVKQAEMISDFASGNAAMMFTYGGQAGTVAVQNPELNIGMFAFPGSKPNSAKVMVQASGGVAIAKTCENVDLAKAFLQFWRLPEEQAKFAEGASAISVDQIKASKTEGYYVGLAGIPFTADITARWPNTTFANEWGSSLQGLLTGQKTAADCIADADIAWNK